MDTWDILNSVYGALYQRVQILGRELAAAGSAARWNRVIWPFELYGVEDYTEDLYRPGMSRDGLPELIKQYGGEIGVAFALPKDCGDDEVMAIVNACREWDTHVGVSET